MALTVPATLSVIVSVWMETLFYGINVMVYFLCIYDLLFARRYSRKTTKRLLISLSTLLFLTATAHVGVNCRRLIEGYVNPPDKISMLKYLIDLTQPTNVAKEFLLALTSLFSDILIIWRIFMVWEKNWMICVFPVLLCTAVFATGLATATYMCLVVPGQNIFAKEISNWGLAHFSLALVMNVSATLLIAARIWWVTRPIRKHDPRHMRPYWRVIVIIVESASFAALAQTIVLAFYASDFPGVYFVSDSAVQIVAMNPLLIIAFVGHTRQQQQQQQNRTSYISPNRMFTEPAFAPRSTETELSEMQFNEPVHLSLAGRDKEKKRTELESDPSTDYNNGSTLSAQRDKSLGRDSSNVYHVV